MQSNFTPDAPEQLRYASRRTRSGVLISYINYTESGQKCNYDFMTKSYKFVILCKPIVAHFAFRRHFFFRREIQTKVPRKNHFFVFFEIYLRKKRPFGVVWAMSAQINHPEEDFPSSGSWMRGVRAATAQAARARVQIAMGCRLRS